MRFALVNGQRQDAQPTLSGECAGCGRPVVAKCGLERVWHWAHKGGLLCDPWWQGETQWHRDWKDQFPAAWQEIVHPTDDGGRHIADVKTGDDWVIEFQHSPIKLDERQSREAFYKKLIWVVDGMRRKRDRTQFFNAWKAGVTVGRTSQVKTVFSYECRLLREWAGCRAPIFFDLGEADRLWWLFAKSANDSLFVGPYPRAGFIHGHRGTAPEIARQFDQFVNGVPKLIEIYELHRRVQPVTAFPAQPRGFRRRFRL